MAKPVHTQPPVHDDPRETALMRSMAGFFDPEWYQARYLDVAVTELDPLLHFIRHGVAEQRDPNRFFDSAWYREHYADVSASGSNPLLHYLQTGAAELRNPHPRFDAAYYASEHPASAANPLLYHIRTGVARGHLTEKPINIRDYLPSTSRALSPPRKVMVDVIIPVYRGLEDTTRCVTSVLANIGKPLGRIIVVDDRSPDRALSAWLRKLAGTGQIELVRNPRNLGFVASVNRGMEVSGTRDVVLLNSDTEVPPGWLARLTAQAYAQPRIATVSPLSNNATICGYPDNVGGPIAFGAELPQVDEICRTVNAGRWVDVPTTVGFCMYIRRAALLEVGPFDAARFGFGYGEENDFCLRATGLGWQHRLACDTFVYHKGSVSFGDRANQLTERAMELILERYPAYRRDIARHVGLGAVVPFRFAVTAALLRASNLPVILMVAHDLGGGVRRHIDSLVQRFLDQARILLLEATAGGAALSVPSMPQHPVLTLPADRIDDLVLVLQSMNVSRVHIHHLAGMDMDIHALTRRLKLPFDTTVHDYYAICPQVNLLPWRYGLYCGEPGIAGCNACIAQRSSHGARDIVTWRADQVWQLKDAERVLCPSVDVLLRLQRHGFDGNAIFAPHEPVAHGPWPLRVNPPDKSGKIRIAVLGTLVDHKGGRTVATVAEMVDPATTEIHLIGHMDGPFSQLATEGIRITGRYDDTDLPRLIEKIKPHLIWFPAVWPETFSYTLSAAIGAGLPIAATRIGAHTERLAGRPYTWLVDIATPPMAWIQLFDEIRAGLTAGKPRAPRKVRSKASDNGSPTAKLAGNHPTRPAVGDFYAMNYLRPATNTKPTHRSGARSTPRIVLVPERFDVGLPTPCAYIRLLQPFHHPAIARDFDVRVATAATVFECDADVIVTQRLAIPDVETVNRLAAYASRIGAALVVDLDDDLLNIPRTHLDAAILRPRAKVVRRLLDLADAVWLSTAGLADRLFAIRSDAAVVENGLDERIWGTPVASSHDQPVRILCMGTTTHDRDFAMIEPALVRLKAEYGDRVIIDVIGMTSRNDLAAGLNRIALPPNAVRSYPGFVNWLTSAQPPWHIGLAPVLDTPFNRCKSPIKAMDYAAMGLVVLASDMPVYRGSVADGKAGWLVPDGPAAWYAALNWLLRNRDLRRTIGARSRDSFLSRHSLASQADARRSACLQILSLRKNHAAA